MKINKLPVGTKLMWDAPSLIPGDRIAYPAIVTELHYNNQWVKIKTRNSTSWMGPEEEYLRPATTEELNTLTWPVI